MKEMVVKVDHYSAAIANKPGEGARVLAALRDQGVNLIADSRKSATGNDSGERFRVRQSGEKGWTLTW
jgi:hypothetical protein